MVEASQMVLLLGFGSASKWTLLPGHRTGVHSAVVHVTS